MSSTNEDDHGRLTEVRGPGAADAERAMAKGDARAVEIYGCKRWLCRSADHGSKLIARGDSFTDVLFAAAISATAHTGTICVYGVDEAGKEIYVLTLQPPSAVVGRWFRERLGSDEALAVGMERAVEVGAVAALLRRKMEEAALAGCDDGPGH